MAERLHVCMTMDVERIRAKSPMGGPPDWAFAERSVRAYCEALGERKLKATLFIVPDTAEKQAAVFRELRDAGLAELGLHLHPQCTGDRYRDPDAHEYLGGYDGAGQRALIEAAMEQFEAAIGARPRTFRGGNFSANDETFGVLTDLGFTHGSVSQPGRAVARVRAVWTDAVWDVHRPHRAFRCAEGDLDFVEVPLTSDRKRTDHWTGVGDVRLEGASADEIVSAASQEVTRQVETGAAVKHVCILTHNFVNYGGEGADSRLGVLKGALDGFSDLADSLGLEMTGSTTDDIRQAYTEREGDGG